jgi:hypothetical protein
MQKGYNITSGRQGTGHLGKGGESVPEFRVLALQILSSGDSGLIGKSQLCDLTFVDRWGTEGGDRTWFACQIVGAGDLGPPRATQSGRARPIASTWAPAILGAVSRYSRM